MIRPRTIVVMTPVRMIPVVFLFDYYGFSFSGRSRSVAAPRSTRAKNNVFIMFTDAGDTASIQSFVHFCNLTQYPELRRPLWFLLPRVQPRSSAFGDYRSGLP